MSTSDTGPTTSRKIRLRNEQQTLLITLYARALDYRSRHPILNDRKADEIVRSIDYDFGTLHGFGNGSIMVARAKQIDVWLREFLESNRNAVVLNVGCGLDTRVSRIDPPPEVSWFDLDYPEVIEERRNFYSNRDGYQMIESSITDSRWLEKVPGGRPTMVIADGVLEYLSEDEVRSFLNSLTDHLPSGQVAFDVMNKSAVQSGRSSLKEKLGAEHRWAVDDIRAVDRLNPRLKRLDNLSVFWSRYLPLRYRILFGVAGIEPSVRSMIRLLRYEF